MDIGNKKYENIIVTLNDEVIAIINDEKIVEKDKVKVIMDENIKKLNKQQKWVRDNPMICKVANLIFDSIWFVLKVEISIIILLKIYRII